MLITSWPAASQSSMASRVFSATPPSEPADGLGRMKASSLWSSVSSRVLSPRMEPPITVDDGSMANTASRLPCPISQTPSASMKVDLPAPGTPEMPIRIALPVCGSNAVSTCWARCWWSARVDSTSVIALASARRWPASTPSTSWRSASDRRLARIGASSSFIRLAARLADFFQHALGRILNAGTRAEDGLGTSSVEGIVILRRNHTAGEDDDVVGALRLQRLDDLRHQRLMTGGQRRAADGMDVVFDRLAGSFFRRLEQRSHVDVEAEVGIGGGDHLGAAIVTVLAELGDHDARPAAFFLGEFGNVGLDGFPAFLSSHDTSVHTRNGLVVGAEAAEDLFQRVRHFADRGTQADRLDRQVEQVAFNGFCGLGERIQRRIDGRRVARCADVLQAGDLRLAHGMVVDVEDLDRVFLGQLVFIDADDDVLARVDARLLVGCTGLDLHLGPAGFDGLGHAAHRLDFLDDAPGLVGHVLGQLFHHVRT